tara:strand:- start:1021 stop:3507 length:2487 start_codon:yes stop_codon:yes gene_type:complete
MAKIRGNETDELLREYNALDKGRERYFDRDGRVSLMSIKNIPHALIKDALPRVTKSLHEKLGDQTSEGAGRPFSWKKDLQAVDIDLIAYLGMATCMDGVGMNKSMTWALTKIGKRIELEIWAKELREFNKKLYDRVESKVTSDHSSERYRLKAAKAIARKAGFELELWTDERRVKAASPVLNSILADSRCFEIWSIIKKGKTRKFIGLTGEASALIAELEADESWLQPVYCPMIVPPRDWDGMHTGAYLDDAVRAQVDLIRFNTPWQRNYTVNNNIANMPYIKALNHIQRTPYVINEEVLAAVKWAWTEDVEIPNFPRRKYVERPVFPDNWEFLEPEDKKLWRISARDVVVRNRQIDGARAVMFQDLKTADEMVNFEEFFLPHNFDFRGRVYPIPHFCHHRDSHVKALFKFKNTEPVDEQSSLWLAIHLANTGDFNKISKESFDDRLLWVELNKQDIIDVARDWKSTVDYWSKADKPFEFLAACVEMTGYWDSLENNTVFYSGLPVALDGTNSGIQHFSALGRNTDDAALVNLVPADKPQDIYQRVADEVINQIKEDPCDEAELWHKHGVTRKTVKRNVMTYGYSSKQYGFFEQIREDLMNPLTDDVLTGKLSVHPFGDDHGYDAAKYLSRHSWEAVNKVISSAQNGMSFFQQLCGALAHEGKHMNWFTPVGFPASQFYPSNNFKKVKIYLYDREAKIPQRTQVTLRSPDYNRVDKRKSKTAISPNVIHSLDSAHLLITVLNCIKNDENMPFFLIHDSFATTAAQTQKLYEVIRESFIEMYSTDSWYEYLKRQVEAQLDNPETNRVPESPDLGELDLNLIAESKYCFS